MVLQKKAIAVSGVVCLDIVHQVGAGVFWAFLDKHAQAIPQDRYHSIIQICPAQHTEMPPASEQAHHAGQWLSDYLIPCAAVNCIISCLCSPGPLAPQRGRCSACTLADASSFQASNYVAILPTRSNLASKNSGQVMFHDGAPQSISLSICESQRTQKPCCAKENGLKTKSRESHLMLSSL